MGNFNSKSIFNFASKSDIIKIILAISIIFVLLHFIEISIKLNADDASGYYTYLWNPLNLPTTIQQFLHQPWSLFTYFFLDNNFVSIIANMIWLWVFGTVIEDLKGPNRILPIFITGGILGGICMLLLNLIKPVPVIYYSGATAGILAVAVAAVMYKPSYKFYILFGTGVPIWIMLLIHLGLLIGFELVPNGPYMISKIGMTIGGLCIGLLYTNFLSNYFEWFTNLLRRTGMALDNKNFVLTKNRSSDRLPKEVPFKKIKSTASKIDDILDKINERGMDSLTNEERRILNDYSNNQIEN